MQTLKEYLMESGVRKDVAVECDEIVMIIRWRQTRFGRQGMDKSQVLMDLGRFRHAEQKTPKSIPEFQRICFDLLLFLAKFNDRFQTLERFDIIFLNVLTGEYEFTENGRRFLEQPVPAPSAEPPALQMPGQ